LLLTCSELHHITEFLPLPDTQFSPVLQPIWFVIFTSFNPRRRHMDTHQTTPSTDPVWQESRDHAGISGDYGDYYAEEGAADRAARIAAIRNDYRWTPACQRAFLEELSCSGSVLRASKEVGKSSRSAYLLYHRRDGAAFSLGWDAAILVSRRAIADMLMDRAIHGYEEISMKDDDGRTVRGKYDNRLSMGLLSRLDRLAEKAAIARSHDAQVQTIVQDFEAFLDLIEKGGTGAAAALFISARNADDAAPLDATLNNAIQCELAQISAAEKEAQALEQRPGPEPELLDLEPEDAAQRLSVWWCEQNDGWRTNFPPAPNDDESDPDADGGTFGDPDYNRALTAEEEDAFLVARTHARQPWIDAALKAREAWFGAKEMA
jgi:hypothetical protein